MTRYTDAYAREIAAFTEFVRLDKTPSPSGDDGMVALALADAALKSIAEGRVVHLTEILS